MCPRVTGPYLVPPTQARTFACLLAPLTYPFPPKAKNGMRHARAPRAVFAQLSYLQQELVGMITFNMGAFFGEGDPSCNPSNWAESP